MPNICDFSMQVTGKNKNILEFYNSLDAEYDYYNVKKIPGKHFFRVSDLYIHDQEYIDLMKDPEEISSFKIDGECAWSVYNCMLPGKNTYYSDMKKSIEASKRDPLNPTTPIFHGTNLLIESQKLNLIIEVFSEEGGAGFHEHYVIKEGKFIIKESTKYKAIHYSHLEEYNQEHGTEYTLQDFNGDVYLEIGGFEWEFGDYSNYVWEESSAKSLIKKYLINNNIDYKWRDSNA